MKKILLLIFILLCIYANSIFAQEDFAKTHTLSGPYTYKNLSIFLIHGEDKLKGKKIITLEEAMKKKKITVYETGNVNQLAVRNKSRNSYIYIQSGDIVKGGKQDRVLQHDIILPPRSKKTPINSFCVEQSRWSKRGNEKLGTFSSSKKQLSSKKLKIATKGRASQDEVWKEVANFQEKAKNNMGRSIKNKNSETSLQLSLEDKKIKKQSKKYKNRLKNITKNKKDAIGYVFVINGEINSADIYSQSKLFKKLWPKLLDASTTEAIVEYKKEKKYKKLSQKNIYKWFKEFKKGKKKKEKVSEHVDLEIKESKDNIYFESYQKNDKSEWIHRNYIKK